MWWSGRALGKESEQAVEAIYAVFDKLWNYFKVTDDESSAYLNNGLKTILKINADQTNANFDPASVAEE